MKKSNFIAMILGTIGGVLLALGMCMVLLPEWQAFNMGVVFGGIGILVLMSMVFIWRRMEHKRPIHLSGKAIGGTLIGLLGSLLLGVGMCLAMLWSQLIIGIVVGLVGIIALLSLIPYVKGIV